MSRIDVYFKEKFITQHRTDSPDQYVIKRSHRHSIWQVWRNDKKLYYKQSKETKTANHPLAVYEQIGLMEQLYAQPSNAQWDIERPVEKTGTAAVVTPIRYHDRDQTVFSENI